MKNAMALPTSVAMVATIPKFLMNESHITYVSTRTVLACVAFFLPLFPPFALTYLGAVSHGLTSCMIFRLIAVIDRAVSGGERRIPYLLCMS
jgi:hypothetical protein